jgi:hypothetical protein
MDAWAMKSSYRFLRRGRHRIDVEPYTYLKDVQERLPRTTNRKIAELTPLKWKHARQSAFKAAAWNPFGARPTCHRISFCTPEQGGSTQPLTPHTTNREVNQLTPLKCKQARQSALKQAA